MQEVCEAAGREFVNENGSGAGLRLRKYIRGANGFHRCRDARGMLG